MQLTENLAIFAGCRVGTGFKGDRVRTSFVALVLPSRKRRDQFKKLMSVCARVICEYLTAKTIKVLRRPRPRGAFVRINELFY